MTPKKQKVLTCVVGDVVLHQGKKMWVCQVIDKGREDRVKDGQTVYGEKASISACPIMQDNGQILLRSPRPIEHNWQHQDPPEHRENPRTRPKKYYRKKA